MSIRKRYISEVDTAGSYSKLQSLASADAGASLNSYGVSLINADSTAGGNVFVLGAPKTGGVHKYIAVTLGTTDSVVVTTDSTTTTFWGSTNAIVTFSTGAGEKYLNLVAASATSWAVVGVSTGVTFSA